MTTRLDGNVLAGALANLFVQDPTELRARCTSCGEIAPIADAVVYPDAPGLVARCRSCNHVLAAVVDAGDKMYLSLSGMSGIAVPK
jgi:phage FluMu protein Com